MVIVKEEVAKSGQIGLPQYAAPEVSSSFLLSVLPKHKLGYNENGSN